MLAAADPVSLYGVTDEVPRAAVPNRRLAFRNGAAVAARAGGNAVEWLVELDAPAQRHAEELLMGDGHPPPARRAAASWSR